MTRKYKIETKGVYTRYTPIAEENEIWVEKKTCWQDGTSSTEMVLMDKQYAAMRVPIPAREENVDFGKAWDARMRKDQATLDKIEHEVEKENIFDSEEMKKAKAWSEKMRSDLARD